MAHILLLHSAIGLRPAVLEFADALRDRGHTLTVPDYYDGQVFDDEAAGIEYRDRVGARVEALTLGATGLADDLVDGGLQRVEVAGQAVAQGRVVDGLDAQP